MKDKMKILITGSTGMVGHNIVDNMSEEKYDILSPSSKELNLLNPVQVKEYLLQEKPEFIIHAAGIVGGIQANIKNPVKFLVENLDMGRNLIGIAYELGVKNVLNLGSSCMYPKDFDIPLQESMLLTEKLEPTNEGYALAKIVVAKLCEYISRSESKYQYKTLIPCNLYGKWDKFSPENSHMIPSVIHKLYQAAQNGLTNVSIWGDGSARREFMYAKDLAVVIEECIGNFEKVPTYMNVGLGYDYSINEYYEAVAKVVGYKGQFTHDLSKPVGMKRKLLDISIQKEFGWEGKTTLEQGIEDTYQFYLTKKF